MGEDQKQHVELARDIALRFNQLYGETFVVPEGVIPEVGARVMGLDDPTQKMSKSADGKDHAVLLTDPDDQIVRTIKRAVTDSGRDIVFSDAPEKAGVKNLLTLYQSLTAKTRAEVEADFAGARGYGDLKQRVAEVVVETVRPIRERFERLMNDEAELDRLLGLGAGAARAGGRAQDRAGQAARRFLPRGGNDETTPHRRPRSAGAAGGDRPGFDARGVPVRSGRGGLDARQHLPRVDRHHRAVAQRRLHRLRRCPPRFPRHPRRGGGSPLPRAAQGPAAAHLRHPRAQQADRGAGHARSRGPQGRGAHHQPLAAGALPGVDAVRRPAAACRARWRTKRSARR